MKHLVYTSAQRGVISRNPGFCTVAMTPGITPLLRQSLEHLSGYRTEIPDSEAHPNLTHMTIKTPTGRRHLISRIAPCAPDYSGRSNTIAHHILIDSSEESTFDPLAYLEPNISFYKVWTGDPRELDEADISSSSIAPPKPCKHWLHCTGDAGHAGSVWRSLRDSDRTVAVLLPTFSDRVELIRELLALVPPGARRGITFSTAPGADSSPEVECRLRLLIDCAKSREEFDRLRSAQKFDLTTSKSADQSPDAECARTGTVFPPPAPMKPSPFIDKPDVISVAPVEPFAHSRFPTNSGSHIATKRAHRSEDRESPASFSWRTAMMCIGMFALGVTITLVIHAVIPISKSEIAADRTASMETNAPSSQAPSTFDYEQVSQERDSLLLEKNKLSNANTQLQSKVDQLTADIHQYRVERQSAEIDSAPINTASTPVVAANAPSLLTLLVSKESFEPKIMHSASVKRAASIQLPGFRARETVQLSASGDNGRFELSINKENPSVSLTHKNPAKSKSDSVATIRLYNGPTPELRFEWNPAFQESNLNGARLYLKSDDGDSIGVHLNPPQSAVCEVDFIGSTNSWRGNIGLKDKSTYDSLIRSSDSAVVVFQIKPGSGHEFTLKAEPFQQEYRIVIAPVRKKSLINSDMPEIDGMSKNLDSVLKKLESLTPDQHSKMSSSDVDSKVKDVITELNTTINMLDQIRRDHAAINALNEHFQQNEIKLTSPGGDKELILRLRKSGT